MNKINWPAVSKIEPVTGESRLERPAFKFDWYFCVQPFLPISRFFLFGGLSRSSDHLVYHHNLSGFREGF
jgi:hypothetical protein